MSTRCPSGCGRYQPPAKFLCAPCWSKVPRDLQRQVYSTWRAYQRAQLRPAAERRPALDAYRSARDAALLAIA